MSLCLRKYDLDWRDIDDEIVALDGRDSVYLSLQGAGALVWRLLAESTSRDVLIQALVATYGIGSERAANDVDHFLAELDERGLLSS